MQATLPPRVSGSELKRLEHIAHDRPALWSASMIELVGLFVFILICNLIFPNVGANLGTNALIFFGLILCLVPAALWLTFFYRMDRLEPEPKHMVISIFVLGALLTAALHGPILQGFFDINHWLYNSWWTHLFGGILVVGFVELFFVYLTVRYGVFHHQEFDERVDGVIYAVAAGLGVATMLNFRYVIANGGVDLGIGSIRIVINALAHASFAGVLGYYIGQSHFEKTPLYYLPKGLTIAAMLNGLFFFLLDRTAGNGFQYRNPWGDLLFATIVATITLSIVFWLIHRANEETLRLAYETGSRGDDRSTDAGNMEGVA